MFCFVLGRHPPLQRHHDPESDFQTLPVTLRQCDTAAQASASKGFRPSAGDPQKTLRPPRQALDPISIRSASTYSPRAPTSAKNPTSLLFSVLRTNPPTYPHLRPFSFSRTIKNPEVVLFCDSYSHHFRVFVPSLLGDINKKEIGTIKRKLFLDLATRMVESYQGRWCFSTTGPCSWFFSAASSVSIGSSWRRFRFFRVRTSGTEIAI